MVNDDQEPEYNNSNILSLLGGILIGSLTGAMTMLFLAPQSGKRTRMQVRQKSIELRDRTTEMLEDAMAQVRSDGKRITKDGHRKAKELMQQGQELVTGQLAQVRSDGKRITKDGRRKAKELMQQGQELVTGQLEYVSDAVQAGKKAIHGLQS